VGLIYLIILHFRYIKSHNSTDKLFLPNYYHQHNYYQVVSYYNYMNYIVIFKHAAYAIPKLMYLKLLPLPIFVLFTIIVVCCCVVQPWRHQGHCCCCYKIHFVYKHLLWTIMRFGSPLYSLNHKKYTTYFLRQRRESDHDGYWRIRFININGCCISLWSVVCIMLMGFTPL